MTVRRAGLLTLSITAGACIAGVLAGLAVGRSGVDELALAGSWGGFAALLLGAMLFAGDATPAFPRMGPDRADPSRYTRAIPLLTSRADLDQAMAENLSRFDRVVGPGTLLALSGLLAIVLSLAVHRIA